MSKKKKTCFLVGLIFVAVISIGLAYQIHQNNLIKKEKQTLKEEITQIYKDFEVSENKSDVLQSFISGNKKYAKYDESEKQYEEIVLKMKEYFKSEYNKVIDENTLENVEAIEDKEQLTTAKNNLISVLETINTSIALSDKEIEKYNADINSIIESYEDRIKAIEDYEAEQKAKEEAEAKAAAEAKTKAEEEAKKNQNNSNKPNGSSGSNGNSNSNNGSSSSKINPNWIRRWHTDSSTGETYVCYIDESTWNVYDENGNYLFNMDGWGF